MNQEDSRVTADAKYYAFRIKKRDVHGLAVLLSLWVLWSEGTEIAKLFGNLFKALF